VSWFRPQTPDMDPDESTATSIRFPDGRTWPNDSSYAASSASEISATGVQVCRSARRSGWDRPERYTRSARNTSIGWRRPPRSASALRNRAATASFDGANGASTPSRVSRARLRSSAVMPRCGTSASHTAADASKPVGRNSHATLRSVAMAMAAASVVTSWADRKASITDTCDRASPSATFPASQPSSARRSAVSAFGWAMRRASLSANTSPAGVARWRALHAFYATASTSPARNQDASADRSARPVTSDVP
jgi:hypothetical protein